MKKNNSKLDIKESDIKFDNPELQKSWEEMRKASRKSGLIGKSIFL